MELRVGKGASRSECAETDVPRLCPPYERCIVQNRCRRTIGDNVMRANDGTRTAAEVLIDQLVIHGVQQLKERLE